MNAATRGVILAIIGVGLGVAILGRGFDGSEALVTVSPTPAADDTVDIEPAPDTETEPTTEDETPATETEEPDGTEPAVDPTPVPDDAAPPDIVHTPAEVRVLVVNGTSTAGAAGTVNNALIADGYNGLAPTNTDPANSATETLVYYVDGFELDARSLALALNYPPTSVGPLPAEVPVLELSEAHVVIILGPDTVPSG